MKEWLLSIIGVVFLGVLFDLIYPNGKTNTFCKSIFGILSVVVIINPLLKIEFSNFDNEDYVDTSLMTSINESKCEILQKEVVVYLKLKGIDGIDVEIENNVSNSNFEVENVFVDISQLVLTENITNINKYEVISNEVVNFLQIDKERIIIYG